MVIKEKRSTIKANNSQKPGVKVFKVIKYYKEKFLKSRRNQGFRFAFFPVGLSNSFAFTG